MDAGEFGILLLGIVALGIGASFLIVSEAGPDIGAVVVGVSLLAMGGGIFFQSGYNVGQDAKTPSSLKGQCTAHVQIVKYPGNGSSVGTAAGKIRTVLLHNAGCKGSVYVTRSGK